MDKYKVILREKLDNKLRDLLSPSDYVVMKLSEAIITCTPEEIKNLFEKYKNTLFFRKKVRGEFEELKQKIEQANTVDELVEIEKKLEGGIE